MLTALAIWHITLRELLLVTALGIAISSLDDFLLDLIYFARTLWRRFAIYTRHERATALSLRRPDPAAIAIIIPAWDESAVIGAMLRNLVRRLDYPRYRVFVGVYPNDPAGIIAVAGIGDRRIQTVICTAPGPTTKADCLNHLWAAVTAHQAHTSIPFKAIVLHDAEDVVHPQELWIFDALIPRLSMVQLPVLPLPDPESRWISGHYLDEFAENHAKDMVVREALGAAVPSAGVACAIDCRILGTIANNANGRPFDAACLTEDYELGHRIKSLGGRGALVRIRHGDERVVVATREHFPNSFDTALRQKTRWLTGIGLAGWDRLGWPGGLADRYMLLRDRKALLASLLTVIAYAVSLFVLIDFALRALVPKAAAMPGLANAPLTALLWVNAALLAWRLLMRAGFTAHAYGPIEGLRAIPRAVASNVINAAAAWAAARHYLAALQGTRTLAWNKTAHRFPDNV
nr:glycosyl transferase family protein [Polymorphobacter sp.]